MTGNLIGGGSMVMLTGRWALSPAVLVLAATVALTRRQPSRCTANPESTARALCRCTMCWVLPPAAEDLLADRRRAAAAWSVADRSLLPELLLVDRGFRCARLGSFWGVLAAWAGIVGGVLGGLGVKLLGGSARSRS